MAPSVLFQAAREFVGDIEAVVKSKSLFNRIK
jgi:hypothetical protein